MRIVAARFDDLQLRVREAPFDQRTIRPAVEVIRLSSHKKKRRPLEAIAIADGRTFDFPLIRFQCVYINNPAKTSPILSPRQIGQHELPLAPIGHGLDEKSIRSRSRRQGFQVDRSHRHVLRVMRTRIRFRNDIYHDQRTDFFRIETGNRHRQLAAHRMAHEVAR